MQSKNVQSQQNTARDNRLIETDRSQFQKVKPKDIQSILQKLGHKTSVSSQV